MQWLIIFMEGSKTLFALQISTGTPKNFFEIYGQFGHAPSGRFASPALGHCLVVTICYGNLSSDFLNFFITAIVSLWTKFSNFITANSILFYKGKVRPMIGHEGPEA